MAKYVHDDNNNRIEALDKEEIYALLAYVIEHSELPVDLQAAFVTMIKSIVDGKAYKMGLCTQAQYNALEQGGELEADTLYIITDDETYDDLEYAISDLNAGLASFQQILGDLQGRVTSLENNYRGNAPYINVSFGDYENYGVETPYNLELTEGTELYVKFSHYGSDLTWYNMTLNVNNNGAQAIAFKGSPILVSDNQAWSNGDIVRLVYQYSNEIDDYVWNVLENITQQIYFGTLYTA